MAWPRPEHERGASFLHVAIQNDLELAIRCNMDSPASIGTDIVVLIRAPTAVLDVNAKLS